jgi:hypothetical protein
MTLASNNNSNSAVVPVQQPEDGAQHRAAQMQTGVDPYLVYFKVCSKSIERGTSLLTLVFFQRNDPECPFYFPMWKKWMIVLNLAAQVS